MVVHISILTAPKHDGLILGVGHGTVHRPRNQFWVGRPTVLHCVPQMYRAVLDLIRSN